MALAPIGMTEPNYMRSEGAPSRILYQFSQPFDVAEQDFSAFDFDESFCRKILEHAGDDFAGGVHVAGDFFLRFGDFVAAALFVCRNQIRGEALVESLEKHLLDCPDGLRITFGRIFKDERTDVNVRIHEASANGRGDDEYVRVFFGGDDGFECELLDDAKGGRNAEFVGMGAVERDFAAFVRDEAHADASAQNEDNAEACGAVATYQLILAEAFCDGALRNNRFFFWRKICPKWNVGENLVDGSCDWFCGHGWVPLWGNI